MPRKTINLHCPSCKSRGRAQAHETYQDVTGMMITRQRRCPKCGHRWRTVEVSKALWLELDRELKQLRQLRDSVVQAAGEVVRDS